MHFSLEILSKAKDMTRGKVLDVADCGLCGCKFDEVMKTG